MIVTPIRIARLLITDRSLYQVTWMTSVLDDRSQSRDLERNARPLRIVNDGFGNNGLWFIR